MKIALLLAALFAAFQPQQQTFYSAKAQPKPVPRHTAQPIPAIIYYPGCTGSNGHSYNRTNAQAPSRSGSHTTSQASTRAGAIQPGGSMNCSGTRPRPAPSLRPLAAHTARPSAI